ncbi:NAD(+)/NADH kinase [bacterium]|nr:NAD(+)/NADH kinase [bacterium]|tara:strand:+ start:2339 stop:3193 length:855 start_codon:yes stop_codon:yes gene_type:complete
MNIGVVCKPNLPNIDEIDKVLLEYFKNKDCKILHDKNYYIKPEETLVELKELAIKSDLILAFGGDGTLLHIAEEAALQKKPVIGFNLGNLGFLTEAPLSNFQTILDNYFKNNLRSDLRNLINAHLIKENKQEVKQNFLNDIVINKGALSKIIDLNVFIDDKLVSQVRADGIIISSPTGSTAYSLSAGGPIVAPNLPLIIITPICPHTLTNRPLVISDKSKVSVSVDSSKPIYVSFDGSNSEELDGKFIINIEKSNLNFNLLRMKKNEYFSVLKNKLMWSNSYEP